MTNTFTYEDMLEDLDIQSGNAVVVLSGGQDSATCLALAMEQFDRVIAISFDYSQRHSIELNQARQMCALVGVDHTVLRLDGLLGGTSPLVNRNEVVEEYASAEALPGGLEKTFVPGRNILFLTLAASYAYNAFVDEDFTIVTGVSQEDYGGYPDCRQDFILAHEDSLNEGLFLEDSARSLWILTPLIDLDKCQTVRLAESLPNGHRLVALSHTCYNGIRFSEGQLGPQVGCGQCHSCLLRSRGFEQAGIVDPALELYATADDAVAIAATEPEPVLASGDPVDTKPELDDKWFEGAERHNG